MLTTIWDSCRKLPVTVAATSKMTVPRDGVVERVEIYDYSGTAGTAETYGYYIMKNNAEERWINNLTVATNERVFSNSTIRLSVAAGDYLEIKRKHPVWATNPATNIVGGYVFINTTVTSHSSRIHITRSGNCLVTNGCSNGLFRKSAEGTGHDSGNQQSLHTENGNHYEGRNLLLFKYCRNK